MLMTSALPTTVNIWAVCPWNDTGIEVEEGHRYNFRADGDWVDLNIRSGPEGNPAPVWAQRFVQQYLRVPGERYFTLIGALDRDAKSIFSIGAELLGWRAPRRGRLTCFANDVPFAYWNNRGSVRLTVEESP